MKKWLISIGIAVIIIGLLGAGFGYWYFFGDVATFANTDVQIIFSGEWFRPADGIQELVDGESNVSNGEFSGSTIADITISPEFPEWMDAERQLTAGCIVALDENTIVTASADDQIGEVQLFPKGTWVVSVMQDNPDRWTVWAFSTQRKAMSICRNAETEIAPNLADVPEDDWFIPVGEADITFTFTSESSE